MALFGLGRKKEAGSGMSLPTDQVMALRQQGYTNDQIIQTLQGQGYKSSQIYDAMSQADLTQQPAAPPLETPQAEQYPQPEQQYAEPVDDKERIEEVAEAIIDEKWNDLLKDINKIAEWNTKTDSRLTKIEQEIKNLKDNFDSLHKGILGKITEYDQNLVNVGTEIKAMEKVFQKVLPTFSENVSKLARITEGVKTNSGRKKS